MSAHPCARGTRRRRHHAQGWRGTIHDDDDADVGVGIGVAVCQLRRLHAGEARRDAHPADLPAVLDEPQLRQAASGGR